MTTGDNLAVDHQLCLALNQAARAVNGCYRPLLAEIGLTYVQYTVMLVLWERGSTTLGELADILKLDSGTLSPLLKRMESKELLRRNRSLDDERRLGVEITDHGRSLRDAAAKVQHSVEAMTGLAPRRLAQLRDQLNDLTKRIHEAQAVVEQP